MKKAKYKNAFSLNIKKLTAGMLAMSLITSTAMASILGSETYSALEIKVAQGTTYINNIFISDQSGVGKQNENYYIYEPNSGVKPAIVNDTYLYGKTKISEMIDKMQADGMYPLMVMNSDYFSLQTGVPMGHQVANGVIITKDAQGEDAIGIKEDGTAFMSWFGIDTTVTITSNANIPDNLSNEYEDVRETPGEDISHNISESPDGNTSEKEDILASTVNQTLSVENINKYPQPYSIYMLTDRFSNTTRHESPNYNVIIGSLSGELKLNENVTGVVEQVVQSDGPINIPKGKIVLTADMNIAPEKLDKMMMFRVGDEVKINNTATGDARWTECTDIQGSIGGRLIKDGIIQNIDQAAAPRSAIGITATGKIIFYTIDGRQAGHSYGIRLKTLSQRLQELGCVDAINLDGGGSTSIAGVYPGTDDPVLLNKPSDGAQRPVATFFALVNTREPSGIPDKLHLSPAGGNYLSGATERFTAKATDTNDHPVAFDEKVTYSSQGSTYTSDDGTAKIIGNGKVKITAKGENIEGSTNVTVFATPDNITIIDTDTSKDIKTLSLGGEKTAKLKAEATVGSKTLKSDNKCYNWSVEGNIGQITQDGIFTSTKAAASGNIVVSAGNKTVKIPVTINGDKYENHTKFEFETLDNIISVSVNNPGGAKIEKQNISISLDGKIADFEYDGEKINIFADGPYEKKIIVAATNSLGYRTIKTYTSPGKAYENTFKDMSSHWAKNTVAYMHNKNIINGVKNPDGTFSFNPDKNMTRAEFAVMMANYMGMSAEDFADSDVPFADADQLPLWASEQIKALYALGIINGKTYSDGTLRFDSNSNISRAEAVTLLTRLFGETSDSKPMNYTDIKDIPSYALDGFKTMISTGVISGYDDNTIRPEKNITRAEAVKMIYGIY